MALPKEKFREIVFQLLYSSDFAPGEKGESVPLIMEQLGVTKRTLGQALEVQSKILQCQSELDTHIRTLSTEYPFERIPRIEKTILRLGAFELLYDASVPPKAVIAEAIRLCRKFAAPESGKYVNAILDALYKYKERSKTQ